MAAAPWGERIIVAGRLSDEDGRPVRHAMVEVWQANAAGRYNHEGDTHDTPLDPTFQGRGRVFTDEDGRYRFLTIRPEAYPWHNHSNAWRPNHIHFSLFGHGFAQRMITQMYFPGDPLLALYPIFHAVTDEAARNRLVSRFDLDLTQPEYALATASMSCSAAGKRRRWQTPTMTETPTPELAPSEATMPGVASAHQTAGPYRHLVDFPEWADTTRHFADALPAGGQRIVLTGTLTDGNGGLVTDGMVEIWHADPSGRYPDQDGDPHAFPSFGRCATDKQGRFRFITLWPGPVPVGPHASANAVQAPHVALTVFARGLLQHLCTRLYFEGETLDETDLVLGAVPFERQEAMIARRTEATSGRSTLACRARTSPSG